MKVFKFGGASLKNAEGIRNVAGIIQSNSSNNLLVVVSAMGKTTDALEKLVELGCAKKNYSVELVALKKAHEVVLNETIISPIRSLRGMSSVQRCVLNRVTGKFASSCHR